MFICSDIVFRPVFVDVRADTQNIDETKIEAAITPRTRAICCVHYGGIACEMDAIMAIARRHSLLVVEDNAHGIHGSYKGQMLGTIGDVAAVSFHCKHDMILCMFFCVRKAAHGHQPCF